MTKQTLSLSDIELDKSFQPRDSLDGTHVNNLTEAYESGTNVPAIEVWKNENLSFLIDGFHRYRAAQHAGLTELPVVYFNGTRSQALARAFELNAMTKLPLSRSERVKYLSRLIEIEPYKSMSSREVEKALNSCVSYKFIQRLRNKDKPVGTNVPVSCSTQQTSELSELKNEIKRLNRLVEQLMEENKQLRGATEQPIESSFSDIVDEDDHPNLCAPYEAAEELDLHVNDIIRAINTKQIPHQSIRGKVKVDINDIKQWRENNE